MEEKERGQCSPAPHFDNVVHANKVIKVLAGSAVEEKAHKIDTAFPGLVAAFVDVRLDIGVLTTGDQKTKNRITSMREEELAKGDFD